MADLQGTLQLIVQRCLVQNVKSVFVLLLPIYWAIGWGGRFFASNVVELDVTYVKENWLDWNHGSRYGSPTRPEMSGIDPTVYSGFALDLVKSVAAMLRYGINDIRGFYQGDIRFSEQFK